MSLIGRGTIVIVRMSLLLAVTMWCVGCGAEATEPADTEPAGPSTAAPAPSSFEQAWTTSLAALEALGPTRVLIVETTEGRATGDEIPPEQSNFGPRTQGAEQLFDVARGRARLTVHTSDRMVKTTIVRGRERTNTISHPLTNSDFISVSRYISLHPPEGLPLPLWAGSAVAPTEGYPDLFQDDSGTGAVTSDGAVERQEDGGTKLSWEYAANGVTGALNLLLDSDYLPVRIDITAKGTAESGEMRGITLEYSISIVYEYEQVGSFSDSDFVDDVLVDGYPNRAALTYELSLDLPRSEQADWGQYWLGTHVEEWLLTLAEHTIYQGDSDSASITEPGDEFILLLYRWPEATGSEENIQVMVRPLRGRYWEDSRRFAEQRVTTGDWVRQETTLAGRAATVYSGRLEGGADNRIDSIYALLPDAFVTIQVWAPVDPLLVLGALSAVE